MNLCLFQNLLIKNTLVFAISQSGETADTLIAVREAKKRGAEDRCGLLTPGDQLWKD